MTAKGLGLGLDWPTNNSNSLILNHPSLAVESTEIVFILSHGDYESGLGRAVINVLP
jgi:hypothetical protein